jgi:ABC-type uncharacterized transport system ATPase subunit
MLQPPVLTVNTLWRSFSALLVIARMTSEDAQCSVILTTHSMEEAEALCSRIGVSKLHAHAVVIIYPQQC